MNTREMTTEKAVKLFERYIDNDAYTNNFQEACRLAIAALRAWQKKEKTKPTDPCELCVYNPPSGSDTKPCCMCPARGKYELGWGEETV